jgi:predicted nucleic-acid-binding protein
MVGLDTNVILRYLLQDDPKQTPLANRIVDQVLSDGNPGLISLVITAGRGWAVEEDRESQRSELATEPA